MFQEALVPTLEIKKWWCFCMFKYEELEGYKKSLGMLLMIDRSDSRILNSAEGIPGRPSWIRCLKQLET